ncbi:hypothetical protein WJ23_33270 [Burkholderia lata]|nr:hypothetical protein WJ23_33270 [Burkholderia lata]
MPDIQTLLTLRWIDRKASRFVSRDVYQSMLPRIPSHSQVHKQLVPVISDQGDCVPHRLVSLHLGVRLHTALCAMPRAREVRKNTHPSTVKCGECLGASHFFQMRLSIFQVL